MTASYTKPTSPAEFQAQINDQAFLADLTKEGPDAWKDYFSAYDKALTDTKNAEVEAIKAEVKDETDATISAFMKDYQAKAPTIGEGSADKGPMVAKSNGAAAYNKEAIGAKLEELDFSAAEYFRAADVKRLESRPDRERLTDLRNKSNTILANYTGTTAADGGLLVPETMRSEIMTLSLEDSLVRSRATVIPMSSGKIGFPMLEEFDRSEVSGQGIRGGLQFFWADEAEEVAESSAKFAIIDIEPNDLIGRTKVPNTLLDDAVGLSSFIAAEYPRAAAWKEDLSFMFGTGVKQPHGFLNSNAVVEVARNTASEIKTEDILKMYSRLLPGSKRNAVWIANQTSFELIAKLELAVGTGGVPLFTFNIANGPQESLLGIPILYSEKMEHAGTAGDLVLADLSYYMIGDRQQLELSVTTDQYHSSNETGFRFISRVDGRSKLPKAVRPYKGEVDGSKDLSPFIKLV